MELGLIGLGRMGANMARRLRTGGIEVVAWDRDAGVMSDFAKDTGVELAANLENLVSRLKPPRMIWLMLPAGAATQQTLDQLGARLAAGDTVVDGANSHYKDSMRRGQTLAAKNLYYIDAGVSGGVWGLQNGYALMLGGEKAALERLLPVVKVLAPAPERGWLHCGPCGAGHFVKMVHNGIEYGMMQAYAEGFALMQARKDFQLDLGAIAETWRHGSVVRSWLLDLTAAFLASDPELKDVAPFVADSGEGRWTALEGIELGVPMPVISLALMQRFSSQGGDQYADKLLAMMRRGFGGHATKHIED